MKDHISVCICTYRRNRMLEYLLRQLATQDTAGLFEFSVVVVDNDVAGPAQEVILTVGKATGLEITYGIEPDRTIPAARNHAIRLAGGNYIGIIDDDEFPCQDWLVTMYRAIQAFQVDGALGPVHPFFELSPPSWLVEGRFCERPVLPTGTILHWGQTRTGNVLLKRDIFNKLNLWFDVSFKTGGSDREFFKQAMRAGCKFVAVKEAPVYEIVPPERWKKSYYLRRAMVNGFNAHRNVFGQLNGFAPLTTRLKLLAKFTLYALAAPVCTCMADHLMMNCLEKGSHHLSHLLATFGIELVKKRNF